ncbi:trehalase [Burkholderia pseudomallei]|uniref:trehalase n=1 Tax=Burkholderia pseudomallei TaxID=28450 RepID=UPI0013791D68|nr:trehalase [Burkholderia pseudomallei]WCE21707.1 trehalase [Burkholderia pseudomallei]WCK59334.1 trehalase [Burkholderia pseudomallei]
MPDASIRARCVAPISGEPLARTMTAVFRRRGSALRAGVHAMPKKRRAARSAGLRGIGTKRPRRRPTRPAAGHRSRSAVPARRAGAAAPASPGAPRVVRAGVRGAPHAAAHGHLREVWEEPLA